MAPLLPEPAIVPEPPVLNPVALDVSSADAPDPAPAVQAMTLPEQSPVATREYVVEPGDFVRTIARQFGVTNETIIWENDLTDPDYVEIGQVLHILPFSGLIHEVRPGDTVASVANTYEARIDDVVSTNHLEPPFIIVVGQKLAVPGGYRPLPKKVVPLPATTVQVGPSEDGLHAAAAPGTVVRRLPVLGGTPQEQFIASIAEAAVESHQETGIPASVTIAQAILESYWGSSRLARDANNYFGIKAQTKPGPAGVLRLDVWEVIGGRNVVQSQPFRVYHTVAESFVDHARFFLENGRYTSALAARGDARQFAREINRGGYATDPGYAAKLIGLMDRYDLYRFDRV
ncbi:MAG TPA: glucosaminidase domain-containing protein [Chloroflexota bacterium]|jgi:LysM repeat protein|nr:glucosaminidase domain-containing protein [Chloroflexota bacterium]